MEVCKKEKPGKRKGQRSIQSFFKSMYKVTFDLEKEYGKSDEEAANFAKMIVKRMRENHKCFGED